MNGLDTALLVLLQGVLWIVLVYFACSRLVNFLAPGNSIRGRILRGVFRAFLISPFRQAHRSVRWSAERLLANAPQYRPRRVHLEDYDVTPLQIYGSIEQTFQERPIVGARVERITRFEWHLFSTRRTYVSVTCRDAVCIIGAFPLGTGLSISWRYNMAPGRIALTLFQVPYIGTALENLFRPETFPRDDFYYAFEQGIRSTVLLAIERVRADQGVRPLQENEVGPLLREFYR